MALTKPRRFILVQSKRNAHVTDDNMEPYHVSTFRRSASMPPLPRLTSAVDSRPSPATSSHCQRDEASNKKAHIFSIHTMKKKSARLSMRLNGVFGLSTRTIDERFNYEEQRFRAMEKFVRVFLRHVSLTMEVLRVGSTIEVAVPSSTGWKTNDVLSRYSGSVHRSGWHRRRLPRTPHRSDARSRSFVLSITIVVDREGAGSICK